MSRMTPSQVPSCPKMNFICLVSKIFRLKKPQDDWDGSWIVMKKSCKSLVHLSYSATF